MNVPGGKSWISEMYGYSFAAATADVWHQQVDYSANLVPGYGPIGELSFPFTSLLHTCSCACLKQSRGRSGDYT